MHILVRNNVIWGTDRENRCRRLFCMASSELTKKLDKSLCTHQQGAKSPYQIVMKFCTGVGVPDIITRAKFSGHRFRGFGESMGQISQFCNDFHRLSLSSLKHSVPTYDTGTHTQNCCMHCLLQSRVSHGLRSTVAASMSDDWYGD